MPWYTNHVIACKVLDRIARHYNQAPLQELKSILDNAAGLLWKKQEYYLESRGSRSR